MGDDFRELPGIVIRSPDVQTPSDTDLRLSRNNFEQNSNDHNKIPKPIKPVEDTLLHQVNDYFKGRVLRGENDPVPTSDGSLLHQVGDFFKGKKSLHSGKALRGENNPVPTSDGSLLHQVGDFFKGKKSLHSGKALRGENDPVPTSDGSLLHQVGDFFKGKKSVIADLAMRKFSAHWVPRLYPQAKQHKKQCKPCMQPGSPPSKAKTFHQLGMLRPWFSEMLIIF
ncbi:uncharacterized protein LOC132545856 [Ylistrum balloti]|uniref:uncharacterized protein LOC132545856 n=1 Tax=Ylistrum balloti TaxID=509963 RepID=UPI0029058104|nr:uncharacterized protein LOC132545856 [Ylistrum balloti]